jgi:hypothetical protein
MHSNENTNAYNKKIGGRMCVTCLFVAYVLSLLSINTLLFVPSYNIEITPHKHTIPIATKSSKTSK